MCFSLTCVFSWEMLQFHLRVLTENIYSCVFVQLSLVVLWWACCVPCCWSCSSCTACARRTRDRTRSTNPNVHRNTPTQERKTRNSLRRFSNRQTDKPRNFSSSSKPPLSIVSLNHRFVLNISKTFRQRRNDVLSLDRPWIAAFSVKMYGFSVFTSFVMKGYL